MSYPRHGSERSPEARTTRALEEIRDLIKRFVAERVGFAVPCPACGIYREPMARMEQVIERLNKTIELRTRDIESLCAARRADAARLAALEDENRNYVAELETYRGAMKGLAERDQKIAALERVAELTRVVLKIRRRSGYGDDYATQQELDLNAALAALDGKEVPRG
jgi:hypothetical protein